MCSQKEFSLHSFDLMHSHPPQNLLKSMEKLVAFASALPTVAQHIRSTNVESALVSADSDLCRELGGKFKMLTV